MQVIWKRQLIGPVISVFCGPRAVALENLGPPLSIYLFIIIFFTFFCLVAKKIFFFSNRQMDSFILSHGWQSLDSRLKQSLDVFTPNGTVVAIYSVHWSS